MGACTVVEDWEAKDARCVGDGRGFLGGGGGGVEMISSLGGASI